MNTKILGTLSEHIGEVTVMRREKRSPWNGHKVFRKQESISKYELLQRGINYNIQQRPRYNSTANIKKVAEFNWKFTKTGKIEAETLHSIVTKLLWFEKW